MLLLTNGQPFYWNNPTSEVYLPSSEIYTDYVDDRIYRLEKILNTIPGKIARKVYRGLRKVKRLIVN